MCEMKYRNWSLKHVFLELYLFNYLKHSLLSWFALTLGILCVGVNYFCPS